MAFRTWGRLLLAAVGVSVLTGAGQLGIGYAFGIIRLTGVPVGDTVNRWPAQLVWVGWCAALAAAAGAALADRLRRGRGLPASTPVHLSIAGVAGLGALVVAPLCMQPARSARLDGVDPVWAVAVCAVLGAVVGTAAALARQLHPPLGWNVASTAGLLWLLALLSVVPSIFTTGPLTTVRLGVLEPSWLDAAAAQRLAPLLLPVLALLVGATTGGLARRHGHPPLVGVTTGVAGPVLVAGAYLAAGSGAAVDRYQAAPYLGALIAVATGALGATAAALLPWPPTAAWRPALATARRPWSAFATRSGQAIEPTDILQPLPTATDPPTGPTTAAGTDSPADLVTVGTGSGRSTGTAIGDDPALGTGEGPGPGPRSGDPSVRPAPAHWDWPTSASTVTPRPTHTASSPESPTPAAHFPPAGEAVTSGTSDSAAVAGEVTISATTTSEATISEPPTTESPAPESAAPVFPAPESLREGPTGGEPTAPVSPAPESLRKGPTDGEPTGDGSPVSGAPMPAEPTLTDATLTDATLTDATLTDATLAGPGTVEEPATEPATSGIAAAEADTVDPGAVKPTVAGTAATESATSAEVSAGAATDDDRSPAAATAGFFSGPVSTPGPVDELDRPELTWPAPTGVPLEPADAAEVAPYPRHQVARLPDLSGVSSWNAFVPPRRTEWRTTTPDATVPGTTVPGTSSPDTTLPGTSSPDTTSADATSAGSTPPKAATPLAGPAAGSAPAVPGTPTQRPAEPGTPGTATGATDTATGTAETSVGPRTGRTTVAGARAGESDTADAATEQDSDVDSGTGRFRNRRGLFGLIRNRTEKAASADQPDERAEPALPAPDEEYVDWVAGLSRPAPEDGQRSLRSPGRHHRD
ncbi:hypothetical protein [Micromonospora yangpuensis]|uniref:Uncharacterized protein n=1 Tax=Micromonospora yangpuensis TaxID=683228 RepID=A0A1C6VAC0_9ACTN|nr:hypothetical protein [Micromonospora yangpuensis]SCL63283.1 hypothetical protein GA0070617_5154 [Micromonospora yangpuensis]